MLIISKLKVSGDRAIQNYLSQLYITLFFIYIYLF